MGNIIFFKQEKTVTVGIFMFPFLSSAPGEVSSVGARTVIRNTYRSTENHESSTPPPILPLACDTRFHVDHGKMLEREARSLATGRHLWGQLSRTSGLIFHSLSIPLHTTANPFVQAAERCIFSTCQNPVSVGGDWMEWMAGRESFWTFASTVTSLFSSLSLMSWVE